MADPSQTGSYRIVDLCMANFENCEWRGQKALLRFYLFQKRHGPTESGRRPVAGISQLKHIRMQFTQKPNFNAAHFVQFLQKQ